MAKKTINLGTSANDRTGTNLRAAFDICNDNFSEVYALVQYKYTDSILSSTPTIAEINAITGVDENTATFGNLYVIIDNASKCYLVTYAAYDIFIFSSTRLTV